MEVVRANVGPDGWWSNSVRLVRNPGSQDAQELAYLGTHDIAFTFRVISKAGGADSAGLEVLFFCPACGWWAVWPTHRCRTREGRKNGGPG